MRLVQLVEAAAGVRPARRLDDAPAFVQVTEAGIGVGLQNAGKGR